MSHAPTDQLSQRHRTIRDAMAERTLDALVVTSLPNILYLTNFSGSSAIVVLTADRLLFITDSRYVEAITEMRGNADECPGLELLPVEASYDATLAAAVSAMPSARIGFEAAHLSVSRHDWLRKTIGGSDAVPALIATEGLVERARVKKDHYELAVLTRGRREAVGGRGARVRPCRPRSDRARDCAGHRLADPHRGVRAAGIRDDCRQRSECGPPPCKTHRANIDRRRPGGAGLWRRLRLILRRPDADRFAWDRPRRAPGTCTRPFCGRTIGRLRPSSRAGHDSRSMPRPGPRSAKRAWPRPLATGQAMDWDSRFTRTRESPGIAGRTRATRRSRREWCSRSSQARTFPGGVACGSRTTWSSPRTGVQLLTDVTTELLEL